jgi:hypothetical protein
MKLLQTFLLLCLLAGHLWAQQLGPQDTITATNRTFGEMQALTQQMNGFGATFFINPASTTFDAQSLYLPGFSTLIDENACKKPLTFSALPHLGFGYGFGAQGSQRLRLDVEQFFAKQILLNVRYDRWQRVGFMRSDELRYSQLQINLHQAGKRHEILAKFGNISDDRQWSGGIQDLSSIGDITMELLPVVKETSRTEKNSYNAQLDFRYRLFGDSLHAFNLASQHQYQLQKRLYLEQESLAQFYPQTFLSPDSCADSFKQEYLDNRLGIHWIRPGLKWSSLLGLRQRMWSDVVANHDTLELNWSNELFLQRAAQRLQHEHEINLIGAAQGWNATTNYQWHDEFWKVAVSHRAIHEWPLLMQRGYQSNLTNYFWSNPQKQFFQQLSISGAYQSKSKTIFAQLKMSFVQYKNVYRFDPQQALWTTNSLASEGEFATLEAGLNYAFGKLSREAAKDSWMLRSNYKFLAQQAAFLPRSTAAIALAWKGGVFKDKRLKLHLEGQLNYISASREMLYFPYMESIDWTAAITGMNNQANINAQFNLALEVKTFRFFVNVANIGTYWTAPDFSLMQGYAFPTMQIRIGLTWDFWN